jgi:hypothetical protein
MREEGMMGEDDGEQRRIAAEDAGIIGWYLRDRTLKVPFTLPSGGCSSAQCVRKANTNT